MTPEDRRAIDALFQRLDAVEQRAREQRDPEAEALISRRLAAQPSSAYYMAQTVIVLQQALEQAQQRIEHLEEQGGRVGSDRLNRRERDVDEPRAGPWSRGAGAGYGGGFLAGAMQTALGVTGGVLLGSMLGGMFGAGTASAAEAGPGDEGAEGDQGDAGDAGGDAGGFDGGGFDGGGFDMGGDF